MIIGLAGEKGSGKDTAAAYLIKKYGFERKAFADPLKRSIAALFNIPFHEVDKYKLDDGIRVVIEHERNFSKHISEMTFRQILQRYGTEAHRDVFGEDFWLDHTLPVGGYYPGRKIVVTDVRFKNEAERVKYLDGYVLRIYRKEILRQDPHSSEQYAFEVDGIVYNNGSVDDFYTSLEETMLEVCFEELVTPK